MSARTTTLGQLAELVGGRVEGDSTAVIGGASPLGSVRPGEITLIDQPERVKHLAATQAAAVVAPDTLDGNLIGGVAAIRVADVHAAFTKIVLHFRPPRRLPVIGVSSHAFVSRSARWGKGVSIHAGATVGDDCQIGDGSMILPGAHLMAGCVVGREATIGPGAVLYENTIVGDRSIVHANVVLGCHGFGYSQVGGRHVLSAQLGYVQIGNDVEIGAGCMVDRGVTHDTRIGRGTKMDNLIHVGHDTVIGANCLLAANVIIAGGVIIEDEVTIWGSVAINKTLRVGKGAVLLGKTGVTSSIEGGKTYWGTPAQEAGGAKREIVWLKRLPEIWERLRKLERKE